LYARIILPTESAAPFATITESQNILDSGTLARKYSCRN